MPFSLDVLRIAGAVRMSTGVIGEEVPIRPFQEAVERSELSPDEIAKRIGYWRTNKGERKGDGTRLLRAVGLRPESNHGRKRTRGRSEEHTSELQSLRHLVCRLLL